MKLTTRRLISLLLCVTVLFSLGAEAWASTLTLPSGLITIGKEAFAGDTALDEVVVPEGTRTIGARAFADSSVRKLKLPQSVTEIAEDAFAGCAPEVTAVCGSYAFLWAAKRGFIKGPTFEDESAYDYKTERAVFTDNIELGLYHESWVRNYQLADYDALAERFGGEPEWSAELVGETYGASLWYAIGEWAGDGKRAIDVGIDNEPTSPCTLHYQVTCAWGGETLTGTGTLIYQETALPTGLDALDEYRGLKVGEAFAFRPEVLPAGYSFGDFEYCELWTGMKCDNWDEWEDGTCVRFIRPLEAGTFAALLVKRFNNIQIRKPIVLYVEDENGEVPAAAPRLEEEYSFRMALSGANQGGYDVDIDNRTLGVSFENLQLLRSLYGDECAWYFETTEGPETDLSWTAYDDYFIFSVDNLGDMEEGAESRVKATLAWGEASAETSLHFTFATPDLPDSIAFERDFAMTVNELRPVSVSFTPADLYGDDWFLHYDFSREDAFIYRRDGVNYSIQALETGSFYARPHLHVYDNLYLYGMGFTLNVSDEQGELPRTFYKPYSIEAGDLYIADVVIPESWDPYVQIARRYYQDEWPLVEANLFVGDMSLTANYFGADFFESAGVTMPASIEEFSQRPGVQSMLQEGEAWTYDVAGNLSLIREVERNGESWLLCFALKQGIDAMGTVILFVPANAGLDIPYMLSKARIAPTNSTQRVRDVVEILNGQDFEGISPYLDPTPYAEISTAGITDPAELARISELNCTNRLIREKIAEYNRLVSELCGAVESLYSMNEIRELSYDGENFSIESDLVTLHYSQEAFDLFDGDCEIVDWEKIGDGTVRYQIRKDGRTYTAEQTGTSLTLVRDGQNVLSMASPLLLAPGGDGGDVQNEDEHANQNPFLDTLQTAGVWINSLDALTYELEQLGMDVAEGSAVMTGLKTVMGVCDIVFAAPKAHRDAEILARINSIASHGHPTPAESRDPQSMDAIREIELASYLAYNLLTIDNALILTDAAISACALAKVLASSVGATLTGSLSASVSAWLNNRIGKYLSLATSGLGRMNSNAINALYERILELDRTLHYAMFGTVKDENGTPLNIVLVTSSDGETTYTDDQGRYQLEAVRPSVTVTFVKYGYGDVEKTVSMVPYVAQQADAVMKSEEQCRICGTVYDADTKEALSGVMVRCYEYADEGVAMPVNRQVETGTNGKFSFILPPGSYMLRFEKEGYPEKTADFAAGSGETDEKDVYLYSNAYYTGVKGTVTDENGQPLREVTIRIENDLRQYQAMTDAKGQYNATVAPGSYSVRATKDGYLPASYMKSEVKYAQVTEGNFSVVDFRLRNVEGKNVFNIWTAIYTTDIYKTPSGHNEYVDRYHQSLPGVSVSWNGGSAVTDGNGMCYALSDSEEITVRAVGRATYYDEEPKNFDVTATFGTGNLVCTVECAGFVHEFWP
jgi:hypothetical protein